MRRPDIDATGAVPIVGTVSAESGPARWYRMSAADRLVEIRLRAKEAATPCACREPYDTCSSCDARRTDGEDVPFLLRMLDELTLRLPRCGTCAEEGRIVLADLRGHLQTLAEADEADPMAGNAAASRPWVDRCAAHGRELHDAESLGGEP